MAFDPENYAGSPETLPDNSPIREVLKLGGVFVRKRGEEQWFIHHPMLVTCGDSQIEAAKEFLRMADKPRRG